MSRVLHRTVTTQPEVAVAGDGIYLTLADGRRVIDGSGGAAVAVIGHGNRRVAQAIGDQAARMAYAHTGFFSSEPAEALAELLIDGAPGNLSRAFFVSSGSEAMEAAIKMGRQYFIEIGQPQRVHFIARRQSYHGNTIGALALGGNAYRRAPYEEMLPTHFSHVSACFPYHGQAEGEGDGAYVARLAAELEAEFQRIGPDKVVAFCAETVVGATAGCVTAANGYFKAMRDVCDRHGALLILDEIMCGMGRTGTVHAWEQEGVSPDIQALAKGLGGGYQPIGAILVSQKVIDGLAQGSGAFVHGHTYQAHPVACAGALEVQKIIREEDLLSNVQARGNDLRDALTARFAQHQFVGDIRGRGLFWAIEIVADRASRQAFDAGLRVYDRIKTAALGAGLGIYPTGGTIDGRSGDHILIAPPYNVTTDQIALIVDRLGASVDEALAGVAAA